MLLKERIQVLIQLGEHLRGKDEYLEALMQRSKFHNAWFTIENQQMAIDAIATQFLAAEKLAAWTSRYDMEQEIQPKTIGLIMAGNIPLVGFQDVLCVFVAGHRSKIKLSDKDKFLMPYLIKLLIQFNPAAADYFEIVNKLKDFEAVIATGSNNSARYFEAYFGKYPHIIRKNRNAVAVLKGDESPEDFANLGKDVFYYFGLGCRNVAKIYVPRGYEFTPLLETLHEYKEIVLHSKYKNNFDYSYAIMILNKVNFKANGCIILTEQETMASGIANLFYEYYDNLEALYQKLVTEKAQIQVVVGQVDWADLPTADFGAAQNPTLLDYADGVDVMDFLLAL